MGERKAETVDRISEEKTEAFQFPGFSENQGPRDGEPVVRWEGHSFGSGYSKNICQTILATGGKSLLWT